MSHCQVPELAVEAPSLHYGTVQASLQIGKCCHLSRYPTHPYQATRPCHSFGADTRDNKLLSS